MRVKDLIKQLQQCDPELEVYAMTDHGGWLEKVMSPFIAYFDPNEPDSYVTDEDEAEEWGYTHKAILL